MPSKIELKRRQTRLQNKALKKGKPQKTEAEINKKVIYLDQKSEITKIVEG